MTQALALYRLQEFELAIIEQRKRIKEIDVLLENNEIVQLAQEQQSQAQASYDEIRHRVKDLEIQIETLKNKHQSADALLYSGKVKNPKELQDIQHEVEALGRRNSELDEQLMELMIQRDTAEKVLNDANAELESITADWNSEHSDLMSEKSQLEKQSDGLMVERKEAVKDVDSATMKEYNSMRTSKSNRPVSVMIDGACSVCGIEQNNAIIKLVHAGDSLIKCQNCGRILVKL